MGLRRPSAADGGNAPRSSGHSAAESPRRSPWRTTAPTLQGGHLAESTRDRRLDAALLDLVPQPLDSRCSGSHVAFELDDFALEVLEACEAVTLPGVLFTQPADREAERFGRRPALVDFRLGAYQIELRREATDLQSA